MERTCCRTRRRSRRVVHLLSAPRRCVVSGTGCSTSAILRASTSASADYLESGRIIAIGFALLICCVAGIAVTRWSQRRYAAMLVFVGIVLAVGVHPIADPSPLMSRFANESRSSLSLAIRSSTRALPLSNFGLALGAGAFATAASALIVRRRPRLRLLVPSIVIWLAVLNLPALFNGGFVDPALVRDQDVPAAWQQAAAALTPARASIGSALPGRVRAPVGYGRPAAAGPRPAVDHP